jgi:hypothetical protein
MFWIGNRADVRLVYLKRDEALIAPPRRHPS